MVAKVRGKPHFLHGVVQFVEIPKKGHSMQQSMGIPLNKIWNQKENQKPESEWNGIQIYQLEIWKLDSGKA